MLDLLSFRINWNDSKYWLNYAENSNTKYYFIAHIEMKCQQKGKKNPSDNAIKPDLIYKNKNWLEQNE